MVQCDVACGMDIVRGENREAEAEVGGACTRTTMAAGVMWVRWLEADKMQLQQ